GDERHHIIPPCWSCEIISPHFSVPFPSDIHLWQSTEIQSETLDVSYHEGHHRALRCCGCELKRLRTLPHGCATTLTLEFPALAGPDSSIPDSSRSQPIPSRFPSFSASTQWAVRFLPLAAGAALTRYLLQAICRRVSVVFDSLC